MGDVTEYFQAAMTADQLGMMGALFLAGLVGGAVHCVGMCGPFVLAQVGARLERVPASAMGEWHRLSGGALIPYHLGRGTTYVLLAALLAGLGGGLGTLMPWRWLAGLLLVLAAVMFLALALGRLRGPEVGLNLGGAIGRWAGPLIDRPIGWRGYLLGVLLGFLPCGMVYAALAAAAARGEVLLGALAMAAFFLGTVPALLGLGLAGSLAASQWRKQAARLASLVMILNALLLLWLAWGQFFA